LNIEGGTFFQIRFVSVKQDVFYIKTNYLEHFVAENFSSRNCTKTLAGAIADIKRIVVSIFVIKMCGKF